MNLVIYSLTGVRKPQVSPDALADLAEIWETVRHAASDAQAQVGAGIAHVMGANQGEVTDAFESYATGEDSARRQLGSLSDAAVRTRDAHREAAVLLQRTVIQMDAVAATAANALLKAQVLPPHLRSPYVAKTLRQVKQDLELLLIAAEESVRASYESALRSLPDPLSVSET